MSQDAEVDKKAAYGCADYREEMRLMGLMRRIETPGLTEDERARLKTEIKFLEEKMGIG